MGKRLTDFALYSKEHGLNEDVTSEYKMTALIIDRPIVLRILYN
jgi:hypothetical protein